MNNQLTVERQSQEQRIEQLETTLRELSYIVKRQSGVIKNLEHRLNALEPKRRRLRTYVWGKPRSR